MLIKEYRICMPLTVDEYKIGQLYMISKHSREQSGGGEGVEVVRNEPCTDHKHGAGQITEKRIYLNSKLPTWMRKFVPMAFYITETAWNFYPYTITEYSCSFLPRFHVRIETHFENDNGCSENVFGDDPTPKDTICFLDILNDPIPEKHYKSSEDLRHWVSKQTGRGPLVDDWRNSTTPIMCSYKRVTCSFEVYGFQGRTEEFIHKVLTVVSQASQHPLIHVIPSCVILRHVMIHHRTFVTFCWWDTDRRWHGLTSGME
ncbi:cytoplasmic phosphatidylinositol transfer protein [Pimephales promelas]|nr:cytoplasmic phosphatidylinositol transfer protein [Pimephales promelas]